MGCESIATSLAGETRPARLFHALVGIFLTLAVIKCHIEQGNKYSHVRVIEDEYSTEYPESGRFRWLP